MTDSDSKDSVNKPGFVRRAAGKLGRGTVKFADYTLLPIREIKSLKRMIGASWAIFKDMMVFSWAIICANSKDLTSSRFYKRVFSGQDDVDFRKSLTQEQQVTLMQTLSPGFFTKRLIGISLVFIVFLLSATSFFVGVFSSDPTYFRLFVSIFVTGFIGLYLWISMRHYERLRAFYEQHVPSVKLTRSKNSGKSLKGNSKRELAESKGGNNE